eukprot:jgi/Galph1/5972/GphlegSOOS_G4619.1
MAFSAANFKKASHKKGKKGNKDSKSNNAENSSKGVPSIQERDSTSLDTTRKEYIFQMHNVSKQLPSGKQILENISLSFFPSAKIGIIGSNGSGKSTLLRIMAGLDSNFYGEARPQDGISIGYLAQDPLLDNGRTVKENIDHAVMPIRETLEKYQVLCNQLATVTPESTQYESICSEMEIVRDRIDALNGWELEYILEQTMNALRCPSGDALVENLSGGEKRRVVLCQLVLKRPDLLLLDEPTNHLDAESVQWLETFLSTFTGTVVVVTHDRYFLDRVTEWILELDRGRGLPFRGNYSSWLEQKQKKFESEQKQSRHLQKIIEKELEWIRSTASGPEKKQSVRINRYEELLKQANVFDKNRNYSSELYIPPGPPLGGLVLEVTQLKKSYDSQLLFENLNFSVPRGAIVGIIGGNGAGKSSLFRMIAGTEKADEGTIRLGDTVQLIYVDQERSGLNPEKSVFEQIADGYDDMPFGSSTIKSRQYLAWFGFKGQDQQKKVKDLSGGEKNRLNLAIPQEMLQLVDDVLKQQGNFLLLDEPTNDLDIETLRNLENGILNFTGSAMIISHDRAFLDRIATHILAFEGNSNVRWFQGNFSDFEEYLLKHHGKTLQPERIKFRRLPKFVME